MKLEDILLKRAENKCELCKSESLLSLYEVAPRLKSKESNCIMICNKCHAQIEKKEELDSRHWACLKESMWSELPAVQVVSWRMLNRLRNESWAMELLDMMYLDDDLLEWAKANGDHQTEAGNDIHKDGFGHMLQTGDTVVLIKSLDVKGSSLNAKLGTVVKNIRLVEGNNEQIEGKIEGQTIVILTKYVRRQNT
ncbi:MAG: PhnA domain-containing protein [Ferruginibacter sp.]